MAMEACEKTFIEEKSDEELEILPPQPRKKQKLYKTLDLESGDPINDVTAATGINLKEEQDLLFYRPPKRPSSRATQEENQEETMLQKIPLRKKLEQIMSKCGIRNMSAETEHCLSLGVEEIMHRLIVKMIRVSKKRLDFEKTKHEIVVTSDIQHQIALMSQKVQRRDKQHEDQVVEVERAANKTTQAAAANIAAQLAIGGEDFLLKWQLMHQKGTGTQRQVTSSRLTKEKVHMLSRTLSGRSIGYLEPYEDAENAWGDIFGRPQKVVDSISIKDFIPVLERELHMLKSTTIYCLNERFKIKVNSTVE